MKFVALALTILLAAGCQAASLQADAPSQLEHVKAAMLVYLGQVKETAQKALTHLDDTEYKQYKQRLTQSLDSLHAYAQGASQTMIPLSEQLMEVTASIRHQVMSDVEELRSQLAPKREALQLVVQKHLDEYRTKLEPVVKEYVEKHKRDMDALKAKIEPLIKDLRSKVQTNVEETKSKLVPMVEIVRAKLTQRLEELRTLAAPYAEEYKEQLVKAAGEVRERVSAHDLHGKIEPALEELRTKLAALYETISQAVKA